MIGRRGFVLGALAAGAGWRSVAARLDEQPPWFRRWFVADDHPEGITGLVTTVYSTGTEQQARSAMQTMFMQATNDQAGREASLSISEEVPLDDIDGTLVTWLRVEGAAAVGTWFVGAFFVRRVHAWSIIASCPQEDMAIDAMHQLVSDLAVDLVSRPDPTTNDEVWNLLPTEDDLATYDGSFRLIEYEYSGDHFNPEGTPVATPDI